MIGSIIEEKLSLFEEHRVSLTRHTFQNSLQLKRNESNLSFIKWYVHNLDNKMV